MEFERFAVTVNGETLFVIPQGDETYIIMKGDDQLGVLCPDCVDDNVVWLSDEMDADLVEKIGLAIEAHDM
jgi:hypothetical protein